MVENEKDETPRVTNSKIGVWGNHVIVHDGIHNYPSGYHKESTGDADLETQIQAYCKKAKSLYEKLSLMGFKTKLRVPILIKDIYDSGVFASSRTAKPRS